MELAAHITRILTPHLGEHTADAVARHLCAKHHVDEGPVAPEKARELQDVIRRGLVAFVGPEKAEQLAQSCMDGPQA